MIINDADCIQGEMRPQAVYILDNLTFVSICVHLSVASLQCFTVLASAALRNRWDKAVCVCFLSFFNSWLWLCVTVRDG